MAEGAIALVLIVLVGVIPMASVGAELVYLLARRRRWRSTDASRRTISLGLIVVGVFAVGVFVAAGVFGRTWDVIVLFFALGYIGLGVALPNAPGWLADSEP